MTVGAERHPSGPVAELIGRLNAWLDESLAPLLQPREGFALVDYPNHNNSGDAAIWLGELAFFRRHQIRPSYVCDASSYNREDLDRAVPGGGPIFLHGGGNFGDLWPRHQLLREQVLQDFPRREVIQLPQTVAFTEEAALSRLTRVAARRSAPFIVHCRDERSMVTLDHVGLDARLCPDMAFALGHLVPPRDPDVDVVVVRRLDHEKVVDDPHQASPEGLRVRETDWLDVSQVRLRRRLTVRTRQLLGHGAAGARGQGVVSRLARRAPLVAHDAMARRRTAQALDIISSGSVLVTDRLHGHILALLMGVPHVLLDERYGKIRGFYETFTSQSPITWLAKDSSDALQISQDIVAGLSR